MTKCTIAGNGSVKEIKAALNFKGKQVNINYEIFNQYLCSFLNEENNFENLDKNKQLKYRDLMMYVIKMEKER